MLTAYYVLGKQITDIHFDSSETSFSVFFRGAQLDAYTDEVAHLEVYSKDGICYRVTDFTWRPTDIFGSIRLGLSRIWKRLKVNTLLLGEYQLQACEKKIALRDLKNKFILRAQETFTEDDATKAKALLDEVSSFDEFEIVLRALSFEMGFDWRDLLLVVPTDPDIPLRIADSEDQLELVTEDLWAEEGNPPIYVYSLREQVMFRLGQGMTNARPFTSDDLQQLKKNLVKPNYYTFTAEQLANCNTLLRIIAFLFAQIGNDL